MSSTENPKVRGGESTCDAARPARGTKGTTQGASVSCPKPGTEVAQLVGLELWVLPVMLSLMNYRMAAPPPPGSFSERLSLHSLRDLRPFSSLARCWTCVIHKCACLFCIPTNAECMNELQRAFIHSKNS